MKAFPFKVHYLLFPVPEQGGEGEPESPLQFGVGVSKRYFKRAVDRNRIKRLVREAYRTQKLPLKAAVEQAGKGHLKVFVLFTGREIPGFEEVKGKVATILQRLEKEVGKLSQ